MSNVLEVYNLIKHFPVRRGFLRRRTGYVRAVDGISFTVGPRETLGLVGESGCGKSTVGRTVLHLMHPTSGEVWFSGQNIAAMKHEELRTLRRQMQIIFQDPFGALNPRLTVEQIVAEPLKNHGLGNRRERREKVVEALQMVGLVPEHLRRFPHEFSGGQRQRIGIARALVLRPRLVVADEPVSALDVSVQAQVLNLLARLQESLNLSAIFISHDLGVVRYISQRVAVMYLGEIVETAPVQDLYCSPLHPYTQALLSAVPVPNPKLARKRIVLSGDVPSALRPPSGCRFHPRCPRRMEICPTEKPVTRQVGDGRLVACHLYNDTGKEWVPPAAGGGIVGDR
jgi:oligopeptide/dipeptide ABC transporter ATP-binding protein